MKKFELTEDFKKKGYICCKSQEEFEDMVNWFKKNNSIDEDFDYNHNYSSVYTVWASGYGLHECSVQYGNEYY